MTEFVDLSWLNDIHKTPAYFSKEPLVTVDVFFIYVNKSNHIDKIVGENHNLINNVLEKETLIGLIQKRVIHSLIFAINYWILFCSLSILTQITYMIS